MSDGDDLCKTVDRFCRFIEQLPAEALEEQTWGPKEVLAHLVYHHELHVDLVEGMLSNSLVVPPEGRFRDLNAKAVSERRGLPVAGLIQRLEKANQLLVEQYRSCDPDCMWIQIKSGAKPRRFVQLMVEVEAHIRNHLWKLQKEY